jgi:hypothetical protein
LITALAAALLGVAAATRLHRWWFSRSWTLAGAALILACMSLHMMLNIEPIEEFVRSSLGAGMPGALKMLLVYGICIGTATVFTDVTSKAGQRTKLIRLHVALSLFTAAISFVFFFKTPWPANVDNRTFDNEYAFLPGYAEGLILAMAYPFLLCLMVTVVTIVQADRHTVTGRGLLLICPGAAILTAYAALRIGYLVAARYGLMEPTPTPFAISRTLALTGVLLIAAGVLTALAMNWIGARAALKQFSDLRAELLTRWPNAERESKRGSSAAEQVDDRAAELLDALSLEVAHSGMPPGEPLPQPLAVDAITEWLVTGRLPDRLGYNSFFLDPGTTDTMWACMLGNAYRIAHADKREMALEQ